MMKALLRLFSHVSIFTLLFSPLLLPAQIELRHLSSFATGVFDEGAAEIADYDPETKRVFFTNADANTIIVLDLTDPVMPIAIDTLELDAYGDGVNSVAIANGLVAVAVEVEDDMGQQPGKVVFFDTDGNFLNEVTVGALPDMVVFSPDGQLVLTANEGEPNDDYTFDPEGSVSIIDVSGGVESATVTTVTFESFNDKKVSLMNRGVRIFGPNATVAQDLEPESIALSPDGSIAYVACQENNALAVIDVAARELLDILPLGVKDHQRGRPDLQEYILNEIVPDWPELGTPAYDGGQDPVQLGGFSGLYFDPTKSDETNYVFYAVPDRGPNADAVSRGDVTPEAPQNLRPFKLPDYQGRFVKFTLNKMTGEVTLDEQILLTQQDGETPITGRGNIPGFDEVPVTFADPDTEYPNVDYTDADGEEYHALPYDPYGGDFEGIVRDNEGNFWMCDEYRPAIYKFQPDGTLIERYVPEGTSELGTEPRPVGFYGAETLPTVYRKRRANRGFEAIAYNPDKDIIYAFIQTPLYNPDNSTRNNSDVIRILGISAADGAPVEEFVYLLERNRDAGVGISRVDKIGDAVYIGNGRFLVLERDSSTPDDGNTGKKYVYEINLTGATNILQTPASQNEGGSGENDKTLEQKTADELAAEGIIAVHKTKVLNLPSIGYLPSDKPEGIALLADGSIAVLNDNDFGLAGAGVSDASSLGIISFDETGNQFDASNRDGEIVFNNWPTLGFFMPDAIATFEQNGANYIISANEGDARDYDGFSEEVRVADLTLDPADYPNAGELQQETNLGRLKTTTANGDLDGDGVVDQIYSYGARSFSIWDATGNLLYDSGDEFEQRTAESDFAAYFNSNNDDNDSFDSRSDDKGPEPEAVTTGMIDGVLYGFIGLERIGGIMVYDLSDPSSPELVQYINNRNFDADAESPEAGDLGVEDIVFIPGSDSPNGEPLILTANEVSGTVSVFSLEVPGTAPEVCEADAGTLEPKSGSDICLENGIATLSTTRFRRNYPFVPEGFKFIYVLTKGSDLVIQKVSNRRSFTVGAPGSYRIHTLVYNPETLDLSIVKPGVTTGFDVNALLIQGGGDICGSLDVAGAQFSVSDCGKPCTAEAGSLKPLDRNICLPVLTNESVEAAFKKAPVVPNGFKVAYVLTYGDELVIQRVSSSPRFFINRAIARPGTFTIHTLVYSPLTLDLSIVKRGVTTGFDVNALLTQGGGDICGALDVAGATFTMSDCGSQLQADASTFGSNAFGESLKVYPNPATAAGQITLDFESAQEGPVQTRIIDRLGRVVRQTQQMKEGGLLQQTLDLNSLPAGMYFIQVVMDNYREQARLVIGN